MATILLLVFSSGAAARRPWEPRVTVEPAENIGRRLPELTPRAIRRFKALYAQAQGLYSAGRYRRTRKLLARAIELNPDHVGARMLHARVLLTLGYLTWNLPMIREARGDIRHARTIEPKNLNLQGMVELLDGLLKRMTSAAPGATRRQRTGKAR